MATMHSLFFGVLLLAVCRPLGAGDGAVGVLPYAIHDVRGHGAVETLHATSLRLPVITPTISPLGVRWKILHIASAEIGVREATGRNDGPRVAEYLAYTGLSEGHAWCAAFVSWCYGQAGQPQPRNPWSPALFPNAKTYWRHNTPPLGVEINSAGVGLPTRASKQVQAADLFGIYGKAAQRINHVGLVKEGRGTYLITVEGNSNDRVESRRRHVSTIYALSDWL